MQTPGNPISNTSSTRVIVNYAEPIPIPIPIAGRDDRLREGNLLDVFEPLLQLSGGWNLAGCRQIKKNFLQG